MNNAAKHLYPAQTVLFKIKRGKVFGREGHLVATVCYPVIGLDKQSVASAIDVQVVTNQLRR